MLETASIASGAVGILFLIIVVVFFVHVQRNRQIDENIEEIQNGHQTNGHQNYGADVTDGPAPCLCQQSQIQISQLRSERSSRQLPTNGNGNEYQQPQHDELQALAYTCECPIHSKPKRPFGLHNHRPLSMEDAILRR